MNRDKIRELLEPWEKLCTCENFPTKDTKHSKQRCVGEAIRQALSLLTASDKCETCGGSGVAPVDDEDLGGDGITRSFCPDCSGTGKKQDIGKAEPTEVEEFDRKIRSKLFDVAFDVGGVDKMSEPFKDLLAALDLLSALEAENKELKKRSSNRQKDKLEHKYEHTKASVKNLETVCANYKEQIRDLEGRLEKARKAIKELVDWTRETSMVWLKQKVRKSAKTNLDPRDFAEIEKEKK